MGIFPVGALSGLLVAATIPSAEANISGQCHRRWPNCPSNADFAAIAVADVVGYSRLMEMDEAGTLAALKGEAENYPRANSAQT